MSASGSQSTLVTAMDTLGVESTTNITPAIGTPIPHTTLSNETMLLLEQTAHQLGQTKDSNLNLSKRRRVDAPQGDQRTGYPKESKLLYLKTKTLHRKKLSLATNIHQIKQNLSDNKFPTQANLNCNTPINRDNTFKEKWATITQDAKVKLTNLILEDLCQKYQTIKQEIQTNLAQLQQLLNKSQFEEISTFLNDRYKAAASIAMNKTSKRLEQRGSRRPQKVKQRPFQQARRPQTSRQNNNLKKLFMGLINSL